MKTDNNNLVYINCCIGYKDENIDIFDLNNWAQQQQSAGVEAYDTALYN